jgi:hypothetical protein
MNISNYARLCAGESGFGEDIENSRGEVKRSWDPMV